MAQHELPPAPTMPASWNEVLTNYFGFKGLTPQQKEACQYVMQTSGPSSVLVLLPTGAGKSLCYQLPAMLMHHGGRCDIFDAPGCRGVSAADASKGFVLVVSPLISLMEDQVSALASRQKKKSRQYETTHLDLHQIPAVVLGSAATKTDAESWRGIMAGQYRLVYASPEYCSGSLAARLTSESLEGPDVARRIRLVAIDEVHCVTQWGHDFRPEYGKLGGFLEILRNTRSVSEDARSPKVMGLSATCPSELVPHVLSSLGLPPAGDTKVVRPPSMDRANLSFEVAHLQNGFEEKRQRLARLLDLPHAGDSSGIEQRRADMTKCEEQSCIVYVGLRQSAERVSEWLTSRGCRASPYHAGLSCATRRETQRLFLVDQIQVVVATVAFGMGVDKPSVRFCVLWDVPATIEDVVQMGGRAGRDGASARIVLFCERSALGSLKQKILNSEYRSPAHKTRLLSLHERLRDFVTTHSCRKRILAAYFGDDEASSVSSPCGGCDNCAKNGSLANGDGAAPADQDKIEAPDWTAEARILMNAIKLFPQAAGLTKVCKLVCGRKLDGYAAARLQQSAVFGLGKHRPLDWWPRFFAFLKEKGLVAEDLKSFGKGKGQKGGNITFLAVRVSPDGQRFLDDSTSKLLAHLPFEPNTRATRNSPPDTSAASNAQSALGHLELSLYRQLLQTREQVAREQKVRPSSVLRLRQLALDGVSRTLSDVVLQPFVGCVLEFCGHTGLSVDASTGSHWEVHRSPACQRPPLETSGHTATQMAQLSTPDMPSRSSVGSVIHMSEGCRRQRQHSSFGSNAGGLAQQQLYGQLIACRSRFAQVNRIMPPMALAPNHVLKRIANDRDLTAAAGEAGLRPDFQAQLHIVLQRHCEALGLPPPPPLDPKSPCPEMPPEKRPRLSGRGGDFQSASLPFTNGSQNAGQEHQNALTQSNLIDDEDRLFLDIFGGDEKAPTTPTRRKSEAEGTALAEDKAYRESQDLLEF